MDIYPKYISGTTLMNRWRLQYTEVCQIIEDHGFQEYECNGYNSFVKINLYRTNGGKFLDTLNGDLNYRYFDRYEIEEFEKRYPLGTQSEFPQDIKKLVKKAAPEIEMIYLAIKKIGFSGRESDGADKKWRQAALYEFDKNEKRFELIKREYLEDKDLYAFVGGKERRDFVRRILKKIVEDHGHKDIGASRLYKHFKSIQNNSEST